MGITIAEARPPYVMFEVKSEEDRAASLEAGHYVAKDVHYAIITPQGSKDRFERRVDEWLEACAQSVSEKRLPDAWYNHYKAIYAAWKADQAMPLNGTSIKNWSVLSPAQIETLTRLRILTIEDIAAANEETIARIGMGARALKDKAVAWLQSTNSQVIDMKKEVDDLKKQNADLSEKLGAAIAALEKIAAQEASQKKSVPTVLIEEGKPAARKL